MLDIKWPHASCGV